MHTSKSYPFWVAILISLAKNHHWARFIQMPNTRSAGFDKSCLLYQGNKTLKCQSLRFFFFTCTFILPPICQRSVEALVFSYKESEEEKIHVLSFVGLVWLLVLFCFLGSPWRKWIKRFKKQRLKSKKEGRKWLQLPHLENDCWGFPGLREREKGMVRSTSEEDQTSRPEGSQGS